jgi:hypothetical protein
MIGTPSNPSSCDQRAHADPSVSDGTRPHHHNDVVKAIKTPVYAITWHGLFIHMACQARLCRDVAAPTYGEIT